MVWRDTIRRVRGFDYADLRFLYIACLATIAIVFSLFRVSQHFLGVQQTHAFTELRMIEMQRDQVAELERLIAIAQNYAAPDFNATAGRLKSLYADILQRHATLIGDGISLRALCTLRVCADVFQTDPFHLTPAQLAADFANPALAKRAHILLLNNFYVQSSIYHNGLKDVLDLSIDQIVAKDHVKNLFNWLSYVFLLVLLLIQAVYVFRPAIRRLNDSLATRSDFLSRISHEIRNPMNSVLGMADILKTTRLNYEQQQYLQNLVRSGQALLEMLNNLIDFSSIESHKITLKPTPFDLFTSLDRCINLISISAHHRNLSVYLRLGPQIANQLEGDSLRLEQVLINLLNNAVKFTEQGAIVLSVTAANVTDEAIELLFSVEDSGIGIRHEQLGEIFESFVQGDSSIQRKYGGSGLGLSISSELIRLMGGELSVTSELGKGSRFFFNIEFKRRSTEFPLLKLQEKTFSLAAAPSEIPANEQTFAHLGASLSSVTSARDLAQLLEDRKGEPTEILIDDSIGIISMINCRNLAEQNGSGERAVALIRSNFPKENMDLLRRNGFARFLIKPLKPWALLETHLPPQPIEETSKQPLATGWEGKLREKNLKMLLVDDSNDNLFLLKEVVQPLASTIHFAENGLEAIGKFRDNLYDIVFMDIQMPVMDGYTAIRKMREIEGTTNRHIPIFAVTAHAGLVDAQKCREAGFTDRIVKPVIRKDIYQQLARSFSVEAPEITDDREAALPAKYLERLIPTYLKTRFEDMVKLQTALDASDFKAISSLGHKIKGSAASYGFPKVSAASLELENAAHASNLELCREIAASLDKMFKEEQAKR